MNSREQYLQKQNERLSNQITVTLTAFQNLLDENEYLASVACGFAWDLSASEWIWTTDTKGRLDLYCSYTSASMDRVWAEGVAAAEKQNLEESDKAAGVQRNPDGSIASILPSTQNAEQSK